MLNHLAIILFFLAATLTCGCSSNVTLSKIHQIQLNKTTDAEIGSLFGKPRATESYTDQQGSDLLQLYGGGTYGHVGPMTWVNYYYFVVESRNGVNSGFLYVCDNGNDATHLDLQKAQEIQIGATRQEVMALLGEPTAMAKQGTSIPQLKKAKFDKHTKDMAAWIYAPQMQGIFTWGKAEITIFMLQFDQNDRVLAKSTLADMIDY
jgi:hypothetical protein